MPVKELDVELTKRGLSKSVAKDNKLLKLGLPTDKLNMWRKMKVSELTQELKARGLKVSGNKDDLLQRLGVPEGYGLTSFEKRMKEHDKKIKEHDKKRKAMVKALGNALGCQQVCNKRSNYRQKMIQTTSSTLSSVAVKLVSARNLLDASLGSQPHGMLAVRELWQLSPHAQCSTD